MRDTAGRKGRTQAIAPGGSAASKRDLNVLIGKNVEAGRIMAGVTIQRAGQLDIVAAARARGHA